MKRLFVVFVSVLSFICCFIVLKLWLLCCYLSDHSMQIVSYSCRVYSRRIVRVEWDSTKNEDQSSGCSNNSIDIDVYNETHQAHLENNFNRILIGLATSPNSCGSFWMHFVRHRTSILFQHFRLF